MAEEFGAMMGPEEVYPMGEPTAYTPGVLEDAPLVDPAHESAMKAELLSWCNDFYRKSKAWRESSFEQNWRAWQRAADAIYDPNKEKEAWQSKAFMALTPSHRETIQSALFRTMFGVRPMLEMKARVESEGDQSNNIRDLILREMEKGEFEIESNKVLEDVTTFGSGFARIRHEVKVEDRRVRKPVYQPIAPGDPRLAAGALPPQPEVIGYQDVIEPVEAYRGVRFEFLSIWDIFPDPKALTVGQGPIIYRYQLTYGDVVDGAARGYYDQDAVVKLRGAQSTEKEQEGKAGVLADRGIQDIAPNRPDYGKQHECYELWAKLPQKWVLPADQIQGDPEKLIPARINFHQDTILSREVSEEYAGMAPIYKMDYWPLNNQFYGRGIPEMLKDYQELLNETVNQRIDNVSLVINKQFAVIEAALLFPKEDAVSKPGNFVRLDGKKIQDVRQAIMELPVTDVTASAYREAIEYERYAQERTSANRVTIGTAGQVKDANQTLGGMELLRQAAGEKFAYIGMLQEFAWLKAIARAYYRQIYANIRPQDVIEALGGQRAANFRLLTPEEVEKSYFYIPQGVYTMENKALRQARVDAIYRTFAPQPWVDHIAFFDRELKDAGEDPTGYRIPPEEMQQMMLAQSLLTSVGGGAAPMAESDTVDRAAQQAEKDKRPDK